MILLAASLATGADHRQRTELRTQTRVQKRGSSQAGDALRREYRYENREQMRHANTCRHCSKSAA